MAKRGYKSLHDYLDRTGTSQTRLLKMIKAKTGHEMSNAMLSMILRGSRRCSLRNAFILNIVTGVPMAELTRWPRYTEETKTQVVA